MTTDGTKRFLGRYCGTEVPSPLLSMHPQVEMIFTSNHAVSGRGFFGTYEFIDESELKVVLLKKNIFLFPLIKSLFYHDS